MKLYEVWNAVLNFCCMLCKSILFGSIVFVIHILLTVIEPPYLNCPNDVDLVLPSHQNWIAMGSRWQPPQTNVNNTLLQVEPKDIGPSYTFYSGKTLVLYRAIFETGQQVTCSYMVTVKGKSSV